jgi:hypothetical protein
MSRNLPSRGGAGETAVSCPPSSPVSLRFAATARCLADVVRGRHLAVPSYRSPPRVVGRRRTLRRDADGAVTISILVRDRPWNAVVNDMIDGVIAANQLEGVAAEELRDACWHAFETIDLTTSQAA